MKYNVFINGKDIVPCNIPDAVIELSLLPDINSSLHDDYGYNGWLYVHDEFIKQTKLLKEEDDYSVDYWIESEHWEFNIYPNTELERDSYLLVFKEF